MYLHRKPAKLALELRQVSYNHKTQGYIVDDKDIPEMEIFNNLSLKEKL